MDIFSSIIKLSSTEFHLLFGSHFQIREPGLHLPIRVTILLRLLLQVVFFHALHVLAFTQDSKLRFILQFLYI